MDKRIITTFVTGLLFFTMLALVVFDVGIAIDYSAFTREVSGWAWSATSGWMSFNDEDVGSGNYSVKVGVDGHLRGHAWSSTVGWVDFDPDGTPPASPDHGAKIDIDGDECGTGQGSICGWARAVEGAEHSSGWDGWIRLGDNGSNDHVCLLDDGNIKGWAWGDTNVGWTGMWSTFTDFESERPSVEDPHPGSPHQVDIIQPPEWYCNQSTPQVQFEWNYKRDNSDYYDVEQGSYRVQVAENMTDFDGNTCSGCVIDESYSGFFNDPDSEGRVTNTYTVGNELDFRSKYWVRVRVEDQYGYKSRWSDPREFGTRIRFPTVDIAQEKPADPYAEEKVYFTDETDYYDWACECDIDEEDEYYEETQENCEWWEVWDGSQCQTCSECSTFVDRKENGKAGTKDNKISWYWEFEDGNPEELGPGEEEDIYRDGAADFDSSGSKEVYLSVIADIETLDYEKEETGKDWLEEVTCRSESPFETNINSLLPDWKEVY